MLSTILSLIPLKVKLIIGVICVVVVLAIAGIIYYQSCKIDTLEKEVTTIQTELALKSAIYTNEITKAKQTIEEQNKSIQQFKIDRTNYERLITQKERELNSLQVIKQTQIEEALRIDSSCDNQLNIIHNMLMEFSNDVKT